MALTSSEKEHGLKMSSLGSQSSADNNITSYTSPTIDTKYKILLLRITSSGFSISIPIFTDYDTNGAYVITNGSSNICSFYVNYSASNKQLVVTRHGGNNAGWSNLSFLGLYYE